MAPVAAPKASMLRHATSTSARRFGSTASTSDDGGSPGAREAARGSARRRTSRAEARRGVERAPSRRTVAARARGNAATRRSTVTPPSTSARGARERDAEDETRALNASDTPDGVASTREDMLASRVSRKPVRAAKRGRDASPRARVGVRVSSSLSETTSARIDSLAPHVNDQFFGAHLHTPLPMRTPFAGFLFVAFLATVAARAFPHGDYAPATPARRSALARRVHRISPRPRVLVHVRRSRHGRTTGVLARRDPCLHPRQLGRRRGGARVLAARHRALRRARRRVGNRLSPRRR